MAKKTGGRLITRLITWPWRRLPWWGKLMMIPALAAMIIYIVFPIIELFL